MSLTSSLRRDWNRALGRERGKCRYGPNEQSVRKVGDFWLGESTNDFACSMAPAQVCPKCEGLGRVATNYYDEGDDGSTTRQVKRCELCRGQCTVPGPHWPWRHEHPGSLPLELLS